MDRKAQEYGYLKQEILDSIGYTKQYRSILYTVTAAILTFAFTQNEPIIFLLPIVVIIPTYIPDSRKRDDEFSPRLAEPPGFY